VTTDPFTAEIDGFDRLKCRPHCANAAWQSNWQMTETDKSPKTRLLFDIGIEITSQRSRKNTAIDENEYIPAVPRGQNESAGTVCAGDRRGAVIGSSSRTSIARVLRGYAVS
jgi:hypothetical protein